MTVVSVGDECSDPLLNFLEEHEMENLLEISPSNIPGKTKIFLNGRWVGVHDNAETLVRNLRYMRRRLDIPKEVSIVRDIANKEVLNLKYKLKAFFCLIYRLKSILMREECNVLFSSSIKIDCS